jgi:transposase
MAKIYHVNLTNEERESLLKLIRSGKPSARKVNRARILLLADEGKTDQNIQEALHTSRSTIERTRKRFVEGNLEYALSEKKRSGAPRKFDGKQEAYLVALACSKPPAGRARWTLQLLSDKLVELGIVDEISDETVRLRLKKTMLNLG